MIVQVETLSKSFKGQTVLHEINLHIKQGEIFGLVGPDGAGKTTLLRNILGLYKPERGIVSLNKSVIKKAIGYVPQQFSLSGDLTVWENITFFANLQQMTDFVPRAEQLLAMVKLDKFKDRLADKLSGGMKQKLALICAIIHRPELLVLDEPTTGVDPVSRREFWQMLYRLNKEGLTIIVSTPYMDEVELCSNIAFLHMGRLRAQGDPETLLAQYPYKLFAFNAPHLRDHIEQLSELPAQSVYFKGETLIVALASESDKDNVFMPEFTKLGIINVDIQVQKPSLEDLFTILTNTQVSL